MKPHIVMEEISKQYYFKKDKPTLAETLVDTFVHRPQQITVLDNVSLKINQGEQVGIIGSNGAGKSTLLEIIAGITTVSSGQVEVNGSLACLSELDAGLEPDLTGEENLKINAAIHGLSKKQLAKKYDSIVDFAGIKNFMKAPLYTYSSGMKLKLSFSLAIHTDPDILLIDECINVGDWSFQKKIFSHLNTFKQNKGTLVLVSHDFRYIENLCDRCLWLSHQKVFKDDSTQKILNEYKKTTL